MKPLLYLSLMLVVLGCGGNSSTSGSEVTLTAPNNVIPQSFPLVDNGQKNHYKVLFMGNSHVLSLPQRITTIINNALPDKLVTAINTSDAMYLDEHLNNHRSVTTFESDDWTHIIFQAQKYSQSGSVEYPTTAAQTWIRRAKETQATPILFPEHPQEGNTLEGRIVHEIHIGIAELESACVAPVGLTWDRVLELKPELVLYRSDGNHAGEMGVFLSALVFYQVITREPADLVPYIDSLNIDEAQQSFLKQIASEVIATNPACEF